MRRRLGLFVEDDLHDAGAVAHVEEEQIAEVAAARDPAHDNGVAAFVLHAELSAVVSAFQVAEKIEQSASSPRDSNSQVHLQEDCRMQAPIALSHLRGFLHG